MANFIVELQGLEKFKETFNPARIPKQIALGTGSAISQLHNSLEHAVFERYKYSKPLRSVLVGKSISDVTFGKNIIKGNLQYKFVPIMLTKFFSPPIFMGNINPGKVVKGRVHSVEVIRGSRKISYGKKHLGGFIPIGRKHLIERDGKEKYPTHPLFAPSLSQMAGHVINTDPSIQYAINNIYTIIENAIEI